MKSHLGRWLVGLGLALLCGWLLLRGLDWSAVGAALVAADYRWVAAAALAVIATFFTRAYRWQALLPPPRRPLLPLLTAILVGQLVNSVLPARSGDLVQAVWAGTEDESGTSRVWGSIAVAKMWDLGFLLLAALLLPLWTALPSWLGRFVGGVALLLGAAAALLWAALRYQEPGLRRVERLLSCLPAAWSAAVMPRRARLADGLRATQRPGVAWRVLLHTALTWGLGWLVNLAVLAAFDLPSPAAALLLLVALMAGGAVPVPAQLGFFEGVCVLVLALFGVARGPALAVGLVLHLVVLGPPLLAALLLTALPGGRRA